MRDLQIVFMGTPHFAVETLKTLIDNNYKVVGVITAPDKPSGRGQKINQSAVKEYAVAQGLHIMQPTNLKDPEFIISLKALKANLQIVVAFRMLPKVVWELPSYGTFNLHASLLPNYRGAAPINWAIINGETKTGVTTFFIDEKIDTGMIILQEEIDIDNQETAGQLHDKLMVLGAKTVLKTVKLIEKNTLTTTKQEEVNNLKTAYKLYKETCKIDWTKSIFEIYNLIRGLNPYPTATSILVNNEKEETIKIHEASITESFHDLDPGTIITEKKELKVAVNGGYLNLGKIQLPGKKKMSAKDLLNGYEFKKDAIMR